MIAQNYSISVALIFTSETCFEKKNSEATTVHPKTIVILCKYDLVTDNVTRHAKPYILKKSKVPDQIARPMWDFMFLK